jgi:hypothetical protein
MKALLINFCLTRLQLYIIIIYMRKLLRKYAVFAVIGLFIMPGFPLKAEISFFLSMETVNRLNITQTKYEFENDALFEIDFGLLEGFILGFENFMCYENEAFFDEIKAGLEIWFVPFLSLGLRPVFFIGDGFSTSLCFSLKLAYDNEDIGFSISDENNFIYYYLDSEFEYINALLVEKYFKMGKLIIFAIGFENEFAWNKEDSFIDTIKSGPGIWIKYLGIYINYKLDIIPDLEHNMEGSIVFEFPGKELK